MTMPTLPLLPDFSPDAVVAYRDGCAVRGDAFLRDVLALSGRLPPAGPVLNVCMDRYWFAVAFFAAIARGLVSLLPNSPATEHMAALCADAPDLVCLGDQPQPPLSHLSYLRVGADEAGAVGAAADMPQIPANQCIARVFTSGSTGQPVAHHKTFGRMRRSAQAEAERLWAVAGGRCSVLGTVPFRHMYGLESTVLLPLLTGGQLSDKTPFFPADVAGALAELPEPRLLVTTPFHLRKLLESDAAIPPVAAILSATAPLSPDLAVLAESRLAAPLLEIYGSTETGQLAMRRPARNAEWETFEDVVLHQEQDATVATGGHLEGAQTLNDVVELLSPSVFRLIDRNANMVNIAGKRSSLAFLNHVIAGLPGVRDGVFCMPDPREGQDVARLAAFVVAPGLSPSDILAALRPHLDPVFLPRPIVSLDVLPRDGNGKIAAAALRGLMAEHLAPRT